MSGTPKSREPSSMAADRAARRRARDIESAPTDGDTAAAADSRSSCCSCPSCFGRALNYATGVIHTIMPPGGILSSAFNMASGSIGAGILGLPGATDSAGLLLAVIYLLIITAFSVYSMRILAITADKTRIRSFEGLGRWLFPYGNYAFSYWAAFIRWFHAFAGNVAYVISIGNCFKPIIAEAYRQQPDNSALQYFNTTSGNRLLTSLVWLCVMLPLAVPKHIDSLRYASAFAILFMIYFVIIIVVHSCMNGLSENVKNVRVTDAGGYNPDTDPNAIFLFRSGNAVVNSVGVFMFAYVCQINALEIHSDMPPSIRNTRNYTWAALIGMLICGILYFLVCLFGYFDFGSKKLLNQSILLMYNPLDEPAVLIAYIGVMCKLCVAYALLTIASRNSIYYMIGWQRRYAPKSERAAMAQAVVAAAAGGPAGGEGLEMGDGSRRAVNSRELDARASSSSFSESGAVRKPASQQQQPHHHVQEGEQYYAEPGALEEDLGLDIDDDDGFDAAAKPSRGAGKGGDANLPPELKRIETDADLDMDDPNDETYIDNIPYWKHLIVVLSLSVASLLCGLFIPNINMVFGFAGAISGGFLAFVFPSLFFMYSGNWTLKAVGFWDYFLTYALLISGVVGIIFGTGGTIYNTI